MKPTIHIHIGKLIEKLEIEVRPCEGQTDSDLHLRYSSELAMRIQGCLLKAIPDAIRNAVETLEKEHPLGNAEKTAPHCS